MAGEVQLWSGKVLLVDGKVAIDPKCCCGVCPCEACGGEQPDAVVSVGTGGSCNTDCCTGAEGTYEFVSFSAASCCWRWSKPGSTECPGYGWLEWKLRIRWTGSWEVTIEGWSETDELVCVFSTDDAEGISCNSSSGHLDGQCQVPGLDRSGVGYVDCSGCIATVDLGG